MLCQECPKKPTCKTLCREAEEYVDQDYCPPFPCDICEYRDKSCSKDQMEDGDCDRKNIISFDEFEEMISSQNADNFDEYWGISNQEAIWKLYRTDHMRVNEIARKLNVSHQYVSRVITEYKNILMEGIAKSATGKKQIEILQLFFIEGVNETQIADIVNINQSNVSRTITRYSRQLRENLKK